ncbi:MAG: hypothetical protein CMN30_15950 [Sandaracinus sp.]|nr:hypothetical protein [Sandaracinus sp.]|tara:strand:- start:1208 stop:2446 length:1239 start_codon:yes stop_codon:yes gene_type:complete
MRGIQTRSTGDVDDPRVLFVLDLAKALHAYGMPAHRLDTMLAVMGERLDLPVHVFTTPTVIIAAFGDPPDQRTYMVTPEQGEVDLGRLAALDELVQDVAEGRLTPAEGSRGVFEVLREPPRYPRSARLAGHAMLAFTVSFLLGGRLVDAALAAAVGLAVGVLEWLSAKSDPLTRLMLPAGAFLAAAMAALGTLVEPTLATSVVGIAGIILLFPGLTLTVAMTEIASGHLVSGTARLSKAVIAFLLLGFGAALGGELAGLVPGVTAGVAETDQPAAWVSWAAIAASIPTLLVLLEARIQDIGWIASAVLLAYAAGHAGTELAGAEMGAGVATLALGVAGNAFARFRNRPAALLITPGILLLVPGSLGFRSVISFVDENLLVALSSAFDVALIAIALVSGLLVANLALPPRKAL